MWECILTFQNGYQHHIHARSFVGLWNHIFEIMVTRSAPVTGIWLARTSASGIRQGRTVEYVD